MHNFEGLYVLDSKVDNKNLMSKLYCQSQKPQWFKFHRKKEVKNETRNLNVTNKHHHTLVSCIISIDLSPNQQF